jgi:hypothetical protein
MTAARIDSHAISLRLGSCEKKIWDIPKTTMYMVVYTLQSVEWPFLWKQLDLYKALFHNQTTNNEIDRLTEKLTAVRQ